MSVRLVEGERPRTGGTAIEVDNVNKIISLLLRAENNLLLVNDDNELYCDLQLESGIAPTDTFPVGVLTGRVLEADGRSYTGTLLRYQTTSGDYCQWLYANNGKLYFDGGTGTWKEVLYSDDIMVILEDYIKRVDFNFIDKTGETSFELELSTKISPTANFTVTAPTELQDGYVYLLRVRNGGTAYTMTLGSGITNPHNVDTTLNANYDDMFAFLCINGVLELQPEIDIVDTPYGSSWDGNTTQSPTLNSVYDKIESVEGEIATKQDILIAGTNIQIASDGVTISATDTVTPVVDNLTSTSTTSALSANQGRILDGKISDLAAIGRFLSLWDCGTGQPQSFPEATPYTYNTGDYYLVRFVSTTNYEPHGSTYDGTASSTVDSTNEVKIGDMYIYDGVSWLYQSNHGKDVTFANIAGQPSDNTNLATALGAKQDTLVSGTNIKTVNSTSLLGNGNVTVQETLVSGTNIKTINGTSILGSGDITTPGATYTAGTGLSLVGTEFSNAGVLSVNGSTGSITGLIPYSDFGYNSLSGTTITLTALTNTLTTSADITVSAGTSLHPGLTYTLRVTNSDSADHTMTFNSQVYVIPEGATVTFKFLALSSSSLHFEGPRFVSTMPATPEEGEIYYVLS